MKKKGAVTTLLIAKMGFILVLIIFFILMGANEVLVDQERLARVATARDVALLLDTSQSIGNTLEYEYRSNIASEELIIDQGIVTSVGLVDGSKENPNTVISKYGFTYYEQTLPSYVYEDVFFTIYSNRGKLSFDEESFGEQDFNNGKPTIAVFSEELDAQALTLGNYVRESFDSSITPTFRIELLSGEQTRVSYSRVEVSQTQQLAQAIDEVLVGFGVETFELTAYDDQYAGVRITLSEEAIDVVDQQVFGTAFAGALEDLYE